MKSPLLDALLDSPALPELLEEGRLALEREQALRAKFHEEITSETKWEFIQGEVVTHSPALNRHLAASEHLLALLSAYVRVHGLGLVRHEKAMTSFPRNDYEPDLMFFGIEKAGLIESDTLRFPIPDLIVEILSPTTEKRDRGIKFEDYAVHGVREYWIVDAVAETIEVFRLDGQVYGIAEPLKQGIVASEVVPGFSIPVRSIFDDRENLAALRSILSGTAAAARRRGPLKNSASRYPIAAAARENRPCRSRHKLSRPPRSGSHPKRQRRAPARPRFRTAPPRSVASRRGKRGRR